MKASVYLPAITCLLIWLVACTNPFTVRTPEDPSGDAPVITGLQTDPDSIIAKIKLALQLKDTEFYVDCFLDSAYQYIPAQNEVFLLNDWRPEDEDSYFRSWVADELLRTIVIEDTLLDRSPVEQSPVSMNFQYLIKLEFTSKTEYYQGSSRLELVESENGLWFIRQWEDIGRGSNNDSTWSTLRLKYR